VKWGRLFIGRHVEPMRPVYEVDEQLMQRIAEAKERLRERQIEPLPLLRLKHTSSAQHMAK
jgi:hypothetical protein